MSGHTPGPWFIDKNGVYALDETNRVNRFSARIDGGYVVYSTHTHIPRVRTSQAEIEANARLILAAPDLLEALEMIAKPIFAHANGDEGPYVTDDEFDEWHERFLITARAAIAKAKGDDHA